MNRLLPIFVFLSMIIVGCTLDEENSQENDKLNTMNKYPVTEDMRQGEERLNEDTDFTRVKSRDELLDGYLTNLEKPNGQNNKYTEGSYREESQRIADEINKFEAVSLTQVIIIDDRILVSPLLDQEKYGPDIESLINDIRQRVEEMYPDKEVIIDEESVYWNRMRDLDAKLNNN